MFCYFLTRYITLAVTLAFNFINFLILTFRDQVFCKCHSGGQKMINQNNQTVIEPISSTFSFKYPAWQLREACACSIVRFTNVIFRLHYLSHSHICFVAVVRYKGHVRVCGSHYR